MIRGGISDGGDGVAVVYQLIPAEHEAAKAGWQAIRCSVHRDRLAGYMVIGPKRAEYYQVAFMCQECREVRSGYHGL